MAKYAIHPACAAAPAMASQHYDALKDDIAERGVVFPLTLHKGKVLDGRHRIQICNELGIELDDSDFSKDDELLEHGGDPWAFVQSTMMHKQPTESQLAMFAAAWAEALKPAAKERQRAAGGDKKSAKRKSLRATVHEAISNRTDAQAGAQFGISGRTVAKAQRVREVGCPQLQQAVSDGRVNVSLAEKVAKTLTGDAQQEAVAVAMLEKKPEKALRDLLPKREKKFDSDSEGDRICDSLRKMLDKWPAEHVPKALNLIRCILQEYSP